MTNQLLKKEERKQAESLRENVNAFDKEAKEIGSSSKEHPIETNSPTTLSNTSQMRLSLKSTALVSDRFGVSDRATAAIASSVLFGLGVVSSESDTSLVIDKNKIRREKHKARQAIKEKDLEDTETKGIYFDGRKDNTLFQDKIGNKMYRRVKKEEHMSIVREPESQYIGHVSPESSSGQGIAESILKYLKDNAFD